MESGDFEPSLKNVLEEGGLKWVLVGGKGGVGKTTCSCVVALLLSRVRDSVLLISTDPAHGLSDALGQKLTGRPTPVQGTHNLFAMEVDPAQELFSELKSGFLKDILSSVPGIDEAVTYAGLLKLVQKDYSVVVLDTASTGHTLRLLSFPELVEKSLSGLLGSGAGVGELSRALGLPELSARVGRLEALLRTTRRLSAELKDPTLTTFLTVCLPDFLSLYETERLVQALAGLRIEARNIIVNQVFPPSDTCDLCAARHAHQAKYLEQIEDLYADFHVTKLPFQREEVRGVPMLTKLSQHLIKSEEVQRV